MRKWLLRLLVAAAVIAAVPVLKATVFAPGPISVRVHEVGRGSVAATVTNSKAGTVKAAKRAKLSPQISGTVVELPRREGEVVDEGELLLRLDDATQRSRLLLARRALERAQAVHDRACIEAQRAERELERNRKLAAEKIVSTDVLDGLESAWELAIAGCSVAEAEVRREEATVQAAQVELDRCELRAPFAGVVAEVAPELGEWVTPAPPLTPVPAVIDLIDPASLYVSAPMDEVDSGRTQVGQEVRVTVDPLPDEAFKGRVTRVAPYVLDVEAQNRTVEIEVAFDDPELTQRLLAGTSADVEVVLEVHRDCLWIPTLALIEGERVFVVEGDVLVERAVRVGLRNWDRTEVLEGLAEGDLVVTSLESAEVQAGAEVVLEAEP